LSAAVPGPSQHRIQAGTDSGDTPGSQSGYRIKPSVRGRGLQGFEAVHVKVIMDTAGQLGADPGHSAEQDDGIGPATQPFQLRPTSRMHEFANGTGDPLSDPRQCFKRLVALPVRYCGDIPGEVLEGIGRAPVCLAAEGIGALLVQERRSLSQPVGHTQIRFRGQADFRTEGCFSF
jgi:hypothetical protein